MRLILRSRQTGKEGPTDVLSAGPGAPSVFSLKDQVSTCRLHPGEAWESLSVWAGIRKIWNVGDGALSVPLWLAGCCCQLLMVDACSRGCHHGRSCEPGTPRFPTQAAVESRGAYCGVKFPGAKQETASEAERRLLPRRESAATVHTGSAGQVAAGLPQHPGNHLVWMCGHDATARAICCFKRELGRSSVRLSLHLGPVTT
ncbi:uncharacterized protein LOC114699662 [Peromyscus leucopus]|uniref:uncharacterized protein LOC114699662 n=1 Tax=Peromyscus leucopus TaxID=10041 RepID=UPI0010A0DB53|nr:uncharacterized protein LOC114699662 [Peromyscus leucopus]